MQVLVNADNHLAGTDELSARIEAEVTAAIDRFGERVTRVEAHLNDEDSGKAGPADRRCVLEARVRGHCPVAVTADAEDYDSALAAAADKLARALDSLLGRLEGKRAESAPVASE